MPNIRRFKLINSTEFQDLKEESRNLATLDLILKSGTSFEKLIWVAVTIFGTFWGFYFMFVQLQVWQENLIVITKADVDLSTLDYPAITICSETMNKFAIGERLGNYLSTEVKPEDELFEMIKAIFERLGENALERRNYHIRINYQPGDVFRNYCYNFSTNSSKNQKSGCKVREF